MGWTFVPLNTIDLSDAINARVEELGGDAVVRLRCRVDPGGASFWNYVLWINLLPFWPGTVTVHVDADVIAVEPREPGPEADRPELGAARAPWARVPI